MTFSLSPLSLSEVARRRRATRPVVLPTPQPQALPTPPVIALRHEEAAK